MSDTANSTSSAGDQLRETASNVRQNIRDAGTQVRDAASEKFEQLRGDATAYYEEGRKRAMEWEHSLEEYVQEKPIQSLLIAAGVGALLGFLWRKS